MKQQVVVIHGGDAFEKYEDYLAYLKSSEISLEKLKSKGWKSNLAEDLGSDFDVILPRMPNSLNARYMEWKIWFEKIVPLLEENILLVGHSMGGIFLARYLSENTLDKKIKAVFLVAAPFYTKDAPCVDFYVPDLLDGLKKQAEKIFLYHSKDDPVVPFEDVEKYKKELPEARVQIFEDRGHFNEEHFPEIVNEIQKL